RRFGSLEVVGQVGGNRFQILLAQGSVPPRFAGGIPHDLLHLGDATEFPQAEEYEDKEGKTKGKFNRGRTGAITLQSKRTSHGPPATNGVEVTVRSSVRKRYLPIGRMSKFWRIFGFFAAPEPSRTARKRGR